MVDRVGLPDDKDLAQKIIEAEEKERGMLGKIFGGKDHAPTNVAALVSVLLILLLVVVLLIDLPEEIPRWALISSLFSTLTLIIGLMFGKMMS